MKNESSKKNKKMLSIPSTVKDNLNCKIPEGAKRIGNYILGKDLFKK
jgi:hypothetical protein